MTALSDPPAFGATPPDIPASPPVLRGDPPPTREPESELSAATAATEAATTETGAADTGAVGPTVAVRPPLAPVVPGRGTLSPLGLDEVRITGGHWGRLQQRNRSATLPHILSWLERSGWAGNFDDVATGAPAERRRGREFSDSEVYKALEALAWQLAWEPDPVLQTAYDALSARVAAAQAPDGYLNTNFGRPGQAARYSDLEWGHELYCIGHLLQAATARLRSGHHDLLVDVAVAAADHVCREFGPHGRQGVCGHAEIEVALAEFGRALGDRRYLDQALLFVDRRGHRTLADVEYGRAYFQDDTPFRAADSLRGHAVRALYLASGAVDVAVEAGDAELLDAARRQLRHAVERRTYLTGGMGSHHQDESFGEDWVLPPDRSYSETCAGVASIMLNWRLLLATGDPGHADLVERTLFNVVSASPDAAGTAFFYTNTLHQRSPGQPVAPDRIVPRAASSLRGPWFEVSCCPPNVARTLASLGGYLATRDEGGLQLHQYADCVIDTRLADGRAIGVTVATDYPVSGTIAVRIDVTPASAWTLALRVPAWAAGATIRDQDGQRTVEPGTVELERVFTAGEVIVLQLPMTPRWVGADPRIDAVRGCLAVERGPQVLCAETVDLPAGADLSDLEIDPDSPVAELGPPTDAGPVAAVTGRLARRECRSWPYGENPTEPVATDVRVPLIPYAQWGNRGPAAMRVWLPVHTTARSTTGP